MDKKNNFLKVASERYACKRFSGRKVPEEKIEALLELIRLSASSYNTQPWRVVVVTDEKTKRALSPHAVLQPQITTCSHLLVFCVEKDRSRVAADLQKAMAAQAETLGERAKALGWVSSLRVFSKAMPPNWEDRQVYLALGNAINGAKALGFASCPMEGFNPAKFKEILKLPLSWEPLVLCPVGYAADKPHKKVRLAKEQIFFPAESFFKQRPE